MNFNYMTGKEPSHLLHTYLILSNCKVVIIMEFVFNSPPQIRFLYASVGRVLLSLCATPGPHNSLRSILQHLFLLCSPSLGGGEGQRDQESVPADCRPTRSQDR